MEWSPTSQFKNYSGSPDRLKRAVKIWVYQPAVLVSPNRHKQKEVYDIIAHWTISYLEMEGIGNLSIRSDQLCASCSRVYDATI